MKPNILALALVTAATALPGSAHAADDFCSRLFIYAINQICQSLPNGQAICQPVGLAGPAQGASCDSPNAQNMVQIPLGPPSIQMLPFTPNAAPYGSNPYAQNPFATNPLAANTFPASTYPPFPFAPNLFGPTPSAPVAAKAPMNAQLASPAPIPAPPKAPASALPPVVVAPVKPVAEATPPAAKPPVKAIPETPPLTSSAVVAQAAPPVTVAKPAPEVAPEVAPAVTPAVTPKAPEPVKASVVAASPAVIAPELPPQKAPLTSKADASAMTPAPKPAIEATVPPVVAAAPVAAQSPADPAPAIDAEADAKAEKAIEDALAHFEFDSAELTPVGRAMLDGWLANTPKDAAIRVTGHADRLGPEPYNDKLSLLRAEAIKKYLTEKGKPANRIQILARGESMPLISCAGDANPETKSCLAPNRRAEITAKPVVKPVEKPAAKPVAKQKAKATVKVKPAKTKTVR